MADLLPSAGLLPDRLPASLLLELLRHLPARAAMYTPGGVCLAASAALAGWLEVPAASLPGRTIEDLWPGEFGRTQVQRLRKALGGASKAIEQFPSPQGSHNVRVVRFPWHSSQGEVGGVVVMFEEQGSLLGKAETVGRLALGMVHDFNNALTLVRGHIDLLDRALGGPLPAEALAELRQALDHASELPGQLLRVVRGAAAVPQRLDLNELLASCAALARPRLGPGVRVHLEPARGGAWADGDPTQLTQVLLNLAINASEAMPNGGELTLRTERAGMGIRITVADTGTGMNDEVRGRIFEPLFTTRPGGSGLGLFMSREVVRRHGGRLTCDSEPGRGATFTLELPARYYGPEVGPGRPVVLVVERDPDIRQLTGVILAPGGYPTILCADLREARFEARRAPVALVLLDAELCAAKGEGELADLLAALPDAKRLYLSTGRAPAPADGRVVSKPYRAEQLLRAVEEGGCQIVSETHRAAK